MDSDYAGTFSTLTRYGTLNVSATRIPRKRRSRGNVAKPRTSAPASVCISIMPDGTSHEFTPKHTRSSNVKHAARTVKHDNARSYFDRVAALGATGNVE